MGSEFRRRILPLKYEPVYYKNAGSGYVVIQYNYSITLHTQNLRFYNIWVHMFLSKRALKLKHFRSSLVLTKIKTRKGDFRLDSYSQVGVVMLSHYFGSLVLPCHCELYFGHIQSNLSGYIP